MRPIWNTEDIENLKTDEKLIECLDFQIKRTLFMFLVEFHNSHRAFSQ